jgi:hypothetical protein
MHPYEWGILGVKAIALLLAIGRTIPSPSSTSADCFARANRRARRDRVGHPSLMPNCTDWLASCPATLHRKGGCPVHSLFESILKPRASVQRASKSKQRASQTFSSRLHRVSVSSPSISNCSHCSLAKTLNW